MQRPVPEPDDVSRFYWEAANDGRLMVQRCAECGSYQYPPTVACPDCLSEALVPTEVSGRGHVYAYTVARQVFDPAFEVPYVLALVALEEAPSVRILTNVVGAEPHEVAGGAPVRVEFERRGAWSIPQFRLASGAPA